MPKIPMLGVRLFDPDDNRFKLTRRFMAHLFRLRQATVEAAKSLSLKELDELVKKLRDHKVDRIERRVNLILAARAKLPGTSHLKTDDRHASCAVCSSALLMPAPAEAQAWPPPVALRGTATPRRFDEPARAISNRCKREFRWSFAPSSVGFRQTNLH